MARSVGHPVTLRSETLLTPYDLHAPGWVTMSGTRISALGRGAPPAGGRIVNLGERLIVPGFVDLHVHGGAGAEVNGDDSAAVAHAVRRLARHHAEHGTTALLASAVSDSVGALRETLRGVRECAGDGDRGGARILGAHLEGPWLAPGRAGAHDKRHLSPPSRRVLEDLTGTAPGLVRMITLAPELDGALDVIAAMVRAGVVASIGHTDADLPTTLAAIDAGARHVTHLFNAMPPLDHRRPGPVGAALTDPRVTVELIADGVHVDPLVLSVVLPQLEGRLVLVTDATAGTGLRPGRFRLGSREIVVSADRAVLADAPHTLAGSVLTMDRAVANLVTAGATLSAAVAAATAVPSRTIGERDRGALRVGAAADIVVLEPELTCAATVVGGKVLVDLTGLLG